MSHSQTTTYYLSNVSPFILIRQPFKPLWDLYFFESTAFLLFLISCLFFTLYESKFPELSLQCLLTHILYSLTPVLLHSLGKNPTLVSPTLSLTCPCPYIAEHGQRKIALLTHLQLRSILQGIPWQSVVKTSTAGAQILLLVWGLKNLMPCGVAKKFKNNFFLLKKERSISQSSYVPFSSVQSLSRVRLFVTPWNCSIPGFPVHHQLLEFTQTRVQWVGDSIQPSHPLLFPSPPAFSLSQH